MILLPYWEAINFRIPLSGESKALKPFLAPNSHFLQPDEYDCSVLVFYETRMRFTAASKIPSLSWDFLTLATRLDSILVLLEDESLLSTRS